MHKILSAAIAVLMVTFATVSSADPAEREIDEGVNIIGRPSGLTAPPTGKIRFGACDTDGANAGELCKRDDADESETKFWNTANDGDDSGLDADRVQGARPIPSTNEFNYTRSGCTAASATTAGGCNGEGLWLLRTDHHWANSPGVHHSTTGSTFAGAAVADAGDSLTHDSESLIIGPNAAWSNCDSLSQFCTTLTSAFDGAEFYEGFAASDDAAADPHFCRNNTTPYAPCSTGATCVSAIAGNDDPEPFIIKHITRDAETGADVGYTYTPVFVTAYAGCNSATNTLTVQPVKIGSAFNSRFQVDAGDEMQAAFNDVVHPAPFYGGYLAQSIMMATVGQNFEPRVNLVGANGYGDDETACDDVADSTGGSNTATGATNAVTFDPTKAAVSGSWSSVSGGACVYTSTESNVIQLKTFAVTQGAYYTVRVRAGVSNTANTMTLRIIDNANAAVTARWNYIVRGDNTMPPSSSVSNLNTRAAMGWNTFVAKVQAPEGATTLRLELTRNSTTGNIYWDDYVVWPSIDPGPNDNYILPSGPHKALLVSDSRDGTADLADNIRAAAAYLRPDISLDLTSDSIFARTLDTNCISGNPLCWNWTAGTWNSEDGSQTTSRAQELADQGYDTAFVLLGVNDYTLVSGGIRPSLLMARMMEAVAAFQTAGIRVIWIQEPPIMGNSTYSVTGSVCRDSNGSSALGCGRYIERVYRLLTRGGLVN